MLLTMPNAPFGGSSSLSAPQEEYIFTDALIAMAHNPEGSGESGRLAAFAGVAQQQQRLDGTDHGLWLWLKIDCPSRSHDARSRIE